MSDFPVTISSAALKRLQALVAKDDRPGVCLRIGVKGGGCSGLEYLTILDDTVRPTDLTQTFEGVLVVCDPKSAPFLLGAELDYSGNLVGGGFQFNNPNAARSCGCGTSFTPKGA